MSNLCFGINSVFVITQRLLFFLLLLSLFVRAYGEFNMILINNSAYDVPGILTLPEKVKTTKADLPALIMLHGTGSQKDEAGDLYKKLADKLAAQGIASLPNVH